MELKGTPVYAPIVPRMSEDVHATHLAEYGRGGWRTVASNTERDAIPVDRRELYMIVVVESPYAKWELVTWSDAETIPSGNWRLLDASPGSSTLIIDQDEDISGDRNGVNKTYELSYDYVPGSVRLYLNGVRQRPGLSYDYVEYDSNKVVFNYAPDSLDTISAEYTITT